MTDQAPTLAIDPGTTSSQIVVWNGASILDHAFLANAELIQRLPEMLTKWHPDVCIEGVACYGMAVGKEVFDTCIWIGRFYQLAQAEGRTPEIIYRTEVKMHLCHSARAKDPNIRQAILDRFGGRTAAIGKKRSPGPLHGIASHGWAALALALTYDDLRSASPSSSATGSGAAPTQEEGARPSSTNRRCARDTRVNGQSEQRTTA